MGWSFVREFVERPKEIGAVWPSGRELARLEVGAADIRPGHLVVELGAGTGPMTAEIVADHPDCTLLALEPNPDLAAILERRFPTVRVSRQYAEALPALIADLGAVHVDRVVSSLPWAIWPEPLQRRVLDAVMDVLAPDARMVTFTYAHSQALPAGRRFRAELERRFAQVTCTRIAWKNMPPARVLVCDRQ